MKRIMIAAAAAATLATAFGGAASAQAYRHDPIGPQLDQLDRRIARGIQRGDLTRREATLLRRDLAAVSRLETQYARGGFTRWEVDDLRRRTDGLAQRVRFERRDADERNRRY